MTSTEPTVTPATRPSVRTVAPAAISAAADQSNRRRPRARSSRADITPASMLPAAKAATCSPPERGADRAGVKARAGAAQMGYAGRDSSARSLRRGSTLTLGVVLGEHLNYAFDDPGPVSFLAGVAEVCAARGYGMTILPISGVAEDVARVTGAAVDGFIVWTTSDDDPVVAAVRATGRPGV